MEKLVRVIKLRPGEVVLIMAEDKPTPGPFCAACRVFVKRSGRNY